MYCTFQERLDLAFRFTLQYLLDADGSHGQKSVLMPERMVVGLRAALIIANQREYKQKAPPLPSLTEVLSTDVRPKGVHSTHYLTDEAAQETGLLPYLPSLRTCLSRILAILDGSLGRPFPLMAVTDAEVQALYKRDDRQSLLSLYRNALVAIPRFLDIKQFDALPLLFRAAVHMDAEVRKLASVVLQCLLRNHRDMRLSLLRRFVGFIVVQVSFSSNEALDQCLRILAVLLRQWHRALRIERDSNVQNEEAGRQVARFYGSDMISSQVCSAQSLLSSHIFRP